ncbi:hypothetical protein BDN67DRAFT_907415 [Paxillus ammoniavirescens]|nr:hypothetical protein BDN67DRAFT_907415 [Paxillus ammoniavirescens]
MIPLLLVSSLLVQLATAAPTNTTSEVPYSDATSNYRSVWSILGTCAVTLFICIWNAIHPNIIAQGKCPCASALYQGALMLMTLFVPEFTVARACTEWVYARRIERDFHEYRWTPTHGFFSLMGGFVLDDGTKRTTLRPCNHLEHLRDGKLVNQDITAEEIDDKSKSDGLAKVILGLQLSWFVLQVIVRGTNHLAITLVEIDTLAMTAVTFPLFFFWWNKPMAPKRPHTLRLKLSQDVPAIHRFVKNLAYRRR